MKVAIMQPYLFPYIGYFQLIKAVDKFVIYDNIEFTKKGWINRNRILVNGKDDYFTLPLKKDSDFLHVNQKVVAETYQKDATKIVAKISELYKKAPQFESVFPMVKSVFMSNMDNLFDFIFYSVKLVNEYLGIKTELIISSQLNIEHNLKGENKVLAICKALNANYYLNSIGGIGLYSKETFRQNELQLHFLKSNPIDYPQFTNEFVPWLSIIDVLMFNSKEKVIDFLDNYTVL